jgi:energy-coupling factor transport system permease protein
VRLDNRAWLAWGLAISVPASVSRNPWLLLECLLVVLFVRAIADRASPMRWLLRLAVVFSVVSLLFNVLTVHSGDRELGSLPGTWPIIGGALTLNALVYGAMSASALLTIVLAWLTVAAHLNWVSLMRQLPDRAAPIAAAGSIAWAWLPAMHTSFRDIRESQLSRGLIQRRPADLPALIVPLLAGGLDRAVTTTDVLDARGFGGGSSRGSALGPVLITVATTSLLAASYLVAGSQEIAAAFTMVFGVATAAVGFRRLPAPRMRTRWRHEPWTRADSCVVATSCIAIIVLLARSAWRSDVLAYSTYPTISTPYADPLAMAALILLFAPAVSATRQ